MDFVLASEGTVIKLNEQTVINVFSCIRHRSRLDFEGMCIDSFDILFQAALSKLIQWLGAVMGSTPLMSLQKLRARCFGKKSSRSDQRDIMAIIPLIVLMQIVDSVLYAVLDLIIFD